MTRSPRYRSWAALGLAVVYLTVSVAPTGAATCEDLGSAEASSDSAQQELQAAQWEVDGLKRQLAQSEGLNTGALQSEVDAARQAYEATAAERTRLNDAAERERLKLVAANDELKAHKQELATMVREWNAAQNNTGVEQVQKRIEELENKIRSWIGNEKLDPLGLDDLQDRASDPSQIEALQRISVVRSGFDLKDEDLRMAVDPIYGGGTGSVLESKYKQMQQQIGQLREWGAVNTNADRMLPQIKKLAGELRGVHIYLGQLLADLETEREDNLRDARDAAGVKLTGVHTQADYDSRKTYLEGEVQRTEAKIGTESAPGPLWQAWNNAKAKLQPFEDLKKKWDDAQARLDSAQRQAGVVDVNALRGRLAVAEGELRTAQGKVRAAEAELSRARRAHAATIADIDSTMEGGRQAAGNARFYFESGQFQSCRDTVGQMTTALQTALSSYRANQGCLASSHGQVPSEVSRLTADLNAVDCTPPSGPMTSGTTPGGLPADVVEVPPVENMFYQHAVAQLRAAGLNAFAYEFKQAQTHADDGKVIAQSHAPGTKVPKGTTVDLAYYSNATESTYLNNPDEPDTTNWVTVPGVLNTHQTAAKQVIAAAGLTPFAFEFRLAPSPQFNGIVTGQNPPPGDIVPPGTTVEIAYNTDWVPPDAPATAPGSTSPTTTGSAGTTGGVGGATGLGQPGDGTLDPSVQGSLDPNFNPFPAGDAGAGGENGTAPPEWRRSGDLDTGSASAPPRTGDAGGSGDGLLGMGEPPNPAIDGFVRQAESAWARCDFPTALGTGGQAAQLAPSHQWVTGRYPALQADAANYEAAQQAMRQAQSLLRSGTPNQEMVMQASSLARQAQSYAPNCMSQQAGALTQGIAQAEASVREASRTQGRTSLLDGVTTLVSALGEAMNQPGYGTGPGTALGPGGQSGAGTELGESIGDALGDLFGGAGAAAGAAAAGPVTGTPLNPANSGQAPQCTGCITHRGEYSSNGLIYVISNRYTFQNQGECRQGAFTAYQLFFFPPDEDDEGRPLNHSSGAERYIQMTGGRRLCGPCRSDAEAQALIRSRCPNPATHLSWDPTRGAVQDGRQIYPPQR